MAGFDLVTGLYVFGGAIVGGIVSWLLRSRQSNRRLNETEQAWQHRIDKAVHQNEQLTAEVASLRVLVEAEQATVQKHSLAAVAARTEIESLGEKTSMVSKNLFAIRAERDELKGQMTSHRNTLNIAKQRIVELQTELNKGQEFYKVQLQTAIDERIVLERKFDDAKSEQQSLNNLLTSAKSEHGSVSQLLTSAQTRLKKLQALEEKVVILEAENVQLEHEAALASREAELICRDVDELNALKEQNSQLLRCLESMDNSRKQHEDDARRYRSQYEQSEQESDTLRFRMGDIQKNWKERFGAKYEANESGNGKEKASLAFGLSEPDGQIDDLTKIFGIGEVLEKSLHDLGIYHYRQIAAFGPAEIARMNSKLKSLNGRIEHDDWISQARELHFNKYGNSE